jgi:hypothetical protein
MYAGERLSWLEKDERLIYCLSKPQHDGQTVVRLTPMEFLDRMAVLIPPPRCHRHRYHGVLAPQEKTTSVANEEQASGHFYSSFWAMLLDKIFEINPLVCPGCGGEMKIIAFVIERQPIGRILQHIGEPDHAPAIPPARGPPISDAEINQTQGWGDNAVDPIPDYEFDQTINY